MLDRLTAIQQHAFQVAKSHIHTLQNRLDVTQQLGTILRWEPVAGEIGTQHDIADRSKPECLGPLNGWRNSGTTRQGNDTYNTQDAYKHDGHKDYPWNTGDINNRLAGSKDILFGINRAPVIEHFKMNMRAGRTSGGAHSGDNLAFLDGLSDFDQVL